ncbi:MAG: efflux RND transporter periplasmic adaptor subunit [Succinivibrionaceae bacterium]|nr:efflux RND transporter periplasmic adaptor subunit [Succinivibrionaceae bacterium]
MRALIVALAALLAAGCNPPEEQAARPADSAPPVFFCRGAHEGEVRLLEQLPGRVKAIKEADVRPEVNGIIKRTLFRFGESVQEGQILYELEDGTYVAALDEAKANLDNARTSEQLARISYERTERLYKIHAVSEQQRDETLYSLRIAEAKTRECEAKARSAEIDLNHTKIRSPVGGIAGISSVTPGALVSARQANALVTVLDTSRVYVDMPLPAGRYEEINRLRALGAGSGMRPMVSLDLGHGNIYPHQGKLIVQEHSVKATTGSLTLRAIVPNPERRLLPGMFVHARITSSGTMKALLVDAAAIGFDEQGHSYVWLVGEDQSVRRRVVTLGPQRGKEFIVEEGLAPGDRVVVRGLNLIRREGMKITPQDLVE